MKRFTPKSILAAVVAFIVVLLFAEGGGTSGPGKTAKDLEDNKK